MAKLLLGKEVTDALNANLQTRTAALLEKGITPTLGLVSRGILILLMYIGRVGGLTLIFSAIAGNQGNTAKLPQEKLTVG